MDFNEISEYYVPENLVNQIDFYMGLDDDLKIYIGAIIIRRNFEGNVHRNSKPSQPAITVFYNNGSIRMGHFCQNGLHHRYNKSFRLWLPAFLHYSEDAEITSQSDWNNGQEINSSL